MGGYFPIDNKEKLDQDQVNDENSNTFQFLIITPYFPLKNY